MRCRRATLIQALVICCSSLVLGGEEGEGLLAPLTAEDQVAPYQVWQGTWPRQLVPNGVNPYDARAVRVDALITSPSGKTLTTPAFFYQPHERSKDRRGHEVVRKTGPASWAVRYAGGEPGRYEAVVSVTLGKGPAVEKGRASFQIVPADPARPSDHGFLRINPSQPTRFRFDSGKGYFALGHNVCWVKRERGTYGFDHYFGKMGAAGENYTRLWLCTWGISLETQRPWQIDLKDAWRLDHVFGAAQRHGIYVKLCIDNFYDFLHNFKKGPYSHVNDGPCRRKVDFFVLPAAKALVLSRMRYLVARYGAYTSLMAWELWNEQNYALSAFDEGPSGSFASDEELRDTVYIPWVREMADALRDMDPYRHLVTSSLGLNTNWPDLWKSPVIDVAQYHSYIHYLDLLRTETEKDAALLVLTVQDKVARFGKPFHVSEFGYMGSGSTSNMNPDDPQGIALHNAIWAGALSGAAGTPSLWWWDNYIDPQDLYFHYRALSKFLKGVDWTEDLVPMRVENSVLRVLALRGTKQVLMWVQNRQSTWYERLRGKREPESLEGLVLALDRFPQGRYRVEWSDPYRGGSLTSYEVAAEAGTLRLHIPPFRLDIAVKLELVGD